MVYCLSCGRPPFRFGEENRRRAPRGPVVIEENRWAERESNPQSQRRLIYSHRQGLRERDANFLAIPKVSLGAGVDSAKGQLPILFSTEPGGSLPLLHLTGNAPSRPISPSAEIPKSLRARFGQ